MLLYRLISSVALSNFKKTKAKAFYSKKYNAIYFSKIIKLAGKTAPKTLVS